ncbi:hypothetical protein [Mycolicibacterium bacteremicum]|uniref:hypothetical protein n=1 Tax=Mycolicibacterium bacteremicum TaxID=564198 RepID=UPI001055A390|nr:hypothetical protein [Mycolicibacterium bacteremicum]MCV7434830.1 hypothetical protein [Mycolicibacterium bacteremicum]
MNIHVVMRDREVIGAAIKPESAEVLRVAEAKRRRDAFMDGPAGYEGETRYQRDVVYSCYYDEMTVIKTELHDGELV